MEVPKNFLTVLYVINLCKEILDIENHSLEFGPDQAIEWKNSIVVRIEKLKTIVRSLNEEDFISLKEEVFKEISREREIIKLLILNEIDNARKK